MDFFKAKVKTNAGGAKLAVAPPTISHTAPKQPAEGGHAQEYRVMGVWQDDVFVVPSVTEIQMDGGRYTKRPGDTIHLTRQEASVVQKHFVLMPVEGKQNGS